MTSYERSIVPVTICLYRTVNEINGYFRRKSHENHPFSHPCIFNAPAEGVSLGIGYRRKGQKKLEWRGYQVVEKVLI